MGVRGSRMTVLNSAGNFARNQCHDLKAENNQRVKCFVFTRSGIVAGWKFSNVRPAGEVRKFLAMVNWPM